MCVRNSRIDCHGDVNLAGWHFGWSQRAEEIGNRHLIWVFRVQVFANADRWDANAFRAYFQLKSTSQNQQSKSELFLTKIDLRIPQSFVGYLVQHVPRSPMHSMCTCRWCKRQWLDRRDAEERRRALQISFANRTECTAPDTYRKRILAHQTAGHRQNIRRIKFLVHRRRLTRINHKKNFVVSLLLPHLFECIGQLMVGDLFGILKFEKSIAAMTRQINQHIAAGIREQFLRSRCTGLRASSQQSNEILNGNLVATVVNLDVIAVNVDMLIGIIENGCRSRIPWIACHIVGNHQNYLAIWNAKSFHRSVNGQHICHMTIVEPKSRRVDQNCPIVGVCPSILGELIESLPK